MTKLALIYGSSRPSPMSQTVANWFEKSVSLPEGVEIDSIDLGKEQLPFLAEPKSPMMGDYQLATTKAWAEKIGQYDGFIFVVSEYNKSVTPILKNAIDTLFAEWKEKAAGLISFGSYPQSTAVEHLRTILSPFEMKVAEPTLHITPFYKAISEDGSVDETMIEGASPQEVLDAMLDSLN